jgi:hypothetical protein
MSSVLATCVCAAFIYWLFRRHAKEASGVSSALWIPLIWVGINASRSVVYWLATGTSASAAADASEGNWVDRNIVLVLMAIGIITLARRRIDWPHVIGGCRWLIVFYLYLLLSTVWSDYTFISFKRWFKDAGDVVIVLVILTEADPVEAFRWVFLRCAYLLVPISVLFIKYYPDLGRYYSHWTWQVAYCGVTTNKNALGLLAMWSGFMLLWQIVDVERHRGRPITLRQIWPDLAVFLMCLWLLSIAQSSTSLACFVLGVAVFFGSRVRVVEANLKNIGLCLAGVALIMIIFTVNADFRGLIAGLLGRNADLTERTEIWDWALRLHTNPLLGSGFSSTLLTFHTEPLVEIDHLSHVHNGYLQTYVDSGMIGVCLLLAILVTAGRNAVRQLAEHAVVGHLFLALFISSLFYNYTEVTFDRSDTFGLLIWLLAAYGVVTNLPAAQADASSGLTDCAPEANSI